MILSLLANRAPASFAPPKLAFTTRLWGALAVAKQRRDLSKLDARALEDIGLSARDVAQETKRGFWEVPAHCQG